MNNTIANIIIENREKLGISQRELAKKLNIDSAYMSRIEQGKIKKISIKLLIDISNKLKISFIDLLFKSYTHEEIEALGVFNNINEAFNFVNDDIIEKVTIKDENNNQRISLFKTLNLYKNNELDIKNTIGLLCCLTNKNLFNYLTENELKDIQK